MKYLNKLLDVLEDEIPTGTNIITWYTRDCFFFRMINNTIRLRSLGDIFLIRYLIYMLKSQMKNCKQDMSNYPKKLYRGACISKNEFEEWRQSKKPFLLQGFTSTTSSDVTALNFMYETFSSFPKDK